MNTLPSQASQAWHSLTTEELQSLLQTDIDHGLTTGEVKSRSAQFGPNAITRRKGKGPLHLLLSQFTQSLIVILIVAGAVTASLKHWIDSGVIVGVVVINALVGFIQEFKAIRAIEALSKAMTAEATVVRNGQRVRLDAVELVPSLTGGGYDPAGELLPFGDSSEDGATSDIASDEVLQELLRAGLLCNDSSVYFEDHAWRVSGDPTEAALVVSAMKAGLDSEMIGHHLLRLDTVPFESEFQYMATLHNGAPSGLDSNVMYVKGSLERLLDRSTYQFNGVPLDERGRNLVDQRAREMASEGLRVLPFAYKHVPQSVTEITHTDVESELVFIGLQGMIDPPRQKALRAIRACHQAGVQVKMITGDHVLTAKAIAARLELGGMVGTQSGELKALTGTELAAISDEDLVRAAEETAVFARVTPEQ